MKKVVGAFVLAVVLVAVLCVSAGCSMGNSDQQAEIDALRQSIESLVAENNDLSDRVEDLENKSNVFWTDKAEYGEHETMTIYFKDTAVFEIALAEDPALTGGIEYINTSFNLKSLVSDVPAASIVGSSYIEWNNGACFADKEPGTAVCKQNIETPFNLYYEEARDAISIGTHYSMVICVPGTPFELARFANVTMMK